LMVEARGCAEPRAPSQEPSSRCVMQYVSVISSNIAAIAYDEAGRVLGVQFRNGREYRYHGVPSTVYRNLLSAGSKGTYFGTFVRNVYACVRVR
jgi:hypothetical protein